MKRLLLLIALTILPATAQANFGRFHALVIGNQNYQHLTKLETPLADAREVAKVLDQQYGFTVDLLLDKTRAEILFALNRLRSTMISEEDNLLIYYAGHGFLDVSTGTGYWQPVDAQTDNTVYSIPTEEITRLLKAIQAKHVLVVADSCYSGSLLMRDSGVRMPRSMEPNEWLRRMQARRSRTALTSGGKEPVVDGGGSGHSVFAQAFLNALRENRNILDGDSLFDKIKRPVILNAPQTPLYGDIRMTGHEMGDFLLVPKYFQKVKRQKPTNSKIDLSYLQRGEQAGKKIGQYQRGERGEQEGKRIGQYIDHGNGTVTDTKTNLMWKRCSEGLSGKNCEKGEAEEYKWNEAVRRFKNVEYAGYKNWRLPTIDELKTLVYCSNKVKNKNTGRCNNGSKEPTIHQQVFPNTTWWYWSGSPNADFSDYAWNVYFDGGYSNFSSRDPYSAAGARRTVILFFCLFLS